MSWEQECRDLEPFFAQAERGEIATAEQIHQAFEAEVRHEVHISSIYRLLDRHGWRKLVPRPRHPKANAGEQDAFQKKNFKQAVQAALDTRKPSDERPVLLMAEDEGCGCPASVSPGGPGLRQECGPTLLVKLCVNIPTCMLRWRQQKAK